MILDVLSCNQCNSEPDIDVTLYQALIKSDKFDTVVQKAVELGVTRIVPVLSERCISRPDEKSLDKKMARWNKIALEAAMQSGRGIIPNVLPVIEYREALNELSKADFSFICYENEPHIPLNELYNTTQKTKRIYKTFSFFVGPEGGISEKEFLLAKEMDIPVGPGRGSGAGSICAYLIGMESAIPPSSSL